MCDICPKTRYFKGKLLGFGAGIVKMFKIFQKTKGLRMQAFLLRCIYFYQRFISLLSPNSCRFYPTCSHYAIWCLKNQHSFLAFWNISLRLLRCNQFFKGGIDYPIKKGSFKPNTFKPCNIEFWFVPIENSKKFYIIKSFCFKEK